MKKYFLILILFIGISCSEKKDDKIDIGLVFSEVSSSLVNEDHTSEGLLITLANNDVVHFYRSDKGVLGHHIGNSGNISKRVSKDNGKSWEKSEIIFNDEFDDRNVRGGITEEGKIILFFRRYDAKKKKAVDLNYIISNDGGNTWGEKKLLNFNLKFVDEVWVDNFIKIGGNKYLLPIHGISYCELRYLSLENDELSISDKIWDWNYTKSNTYRIDEPFFSYLGDNKIIGLFRDESKEVGANYYQVTSSDLGKTWTSPMRTNLCAPYFSPSPSIFYDKLFKKIIVVGTDRRKPKNGGYSPENAKVWVYSNSVEEVFENPFGYSLKKKFDRPTPSSFRFYGYPTFTKINDNSYLIVFTESSHNGKSEDADLYQFKLKFNK
ncbi:sialidase family protein [Tenacibaculum ovolyticum]|uniref:sialidase family protein n=1 Tax=Tenacibaculum ovolyticum TaxID=104270 RepID=UPI0022F38D5E|nr:sialidase family protein [Tenacibaculum ovolyticum]WBX76167.1 sialidase family protein [Tenacibaculum ovolyticum]